jgi:hypothetical protein
MRALQVVVEHRFNSERATEFTTMMRLTSAAAIAALVRKD